MYIESYQITFYDDRYESVLLAKKGCRREGVAFPSRHFFFFYSVAHPYQHLEAPRIVAEPKPSIVGWGDAILSCNASGNATISWFRADGTIVARATPTIVIDEGETDGELAYYCAATIAHVGTVRSHTTKVKFHHGNHTYMCIRFPTTYSTILIF